MNFKSAAKINEILGCEIKKIQAKRGTYAHERKRVKETILAAVALLHKELEWQREKRPPPYVITWIAAQNLRKKVRTAESLRRGGPLTRAQRALIRKLRRTKMSLKAHMRM